MYIVTYSEFLFGDTACILHLKFPVILSLSKLLFFLLSIFFEQQSLRAEPHLQYQNSAGYVPATYNKLVSHEQYSHKAS